MLFICKSPAIKSDLLDSVLHTAQTYHLDCILVLSALKDENPLLFLQEQIRNDKEKDADTIVKELCEANCPEQVLVLLKDVLRYMESELPKYQSKDLTKEELEDLKRNITSLDLTNPDINILKYVLIRMSVAVQDCTTITTKDNQEIPGYFPRLTQLASLLLLLLSQLTSNKGCLLEIGTGEGKSCILAMFATILAIRGTKVDIVTSSPVLARRDEEEWKKFFKMFGITSSVVPPPFPSNYSPEEQEKCLQDAYRQQIVYGTVGVFAADTLKQEFEKRTTRDTRPFELVIVDEVDYMTLDNGVQVTFLSHESSGFRHVEQVLSNIWVMISNCQPIEMLETGEIKWATRMQYFHNAVTAAVMAQEPSDNFSANEILLPGVPLGFYTQQDIDMIQTESKKMKESQGDGYEDGMSKALSEVMKKLGVSQQYDLLSVCEEVLENSIVFKCYSLENKKAKFFGVREKPAELIVEMLLLEGGLACEIMPEKSLIDATVSTIRSFIKYSDNLPTAEESKTYIVIPLFLKTYVENQLTIFVENALKAVEMSQGREYMIDTSQAAERERADSPDRHEYNAIIPVDFKASGILEKNKKWGNGLQQFLEFKHQLAISQISNVTNYMSNFHFFKRYLSGSGIFGVSGTLGGMADREFLARHYKAESYTIPAHRHKRLVELPVIQVKGGNDQWIQAICETSWKASERGQVVLVICEDVKTADVLYVKIQDGDRFKPEQITLYTISEKHNVEREKFCGGRIIIATNLGGRGTDIKVDQRVNECGGLFVLLTHFPHNRRVEKQIFGRTSRKGNPGMVQMVVNCDHLAPTYQGQSVEIMRQLREDYEIKRIHDMESDELVEINLKENLFSTFCGLLKNFDGNYTQDEKKDPMRLDLNDIPDCFKCYQHKFDYQPAVNALKESWALWLTLHEEHINRHDDISELQADLSRTISETSGKLLQGECDNFYDHVRQAIVRTDLHCRNISNSDYGAESYWKNVVASDPHYKAVALYNLAYITINLGRNNCIAEALNLLKDAKKFIDVHILEVSNTMISCNLAITGNKDQSTDYNNFQSQMEARMNIFKSWITYIDNALIKLKELENKKKEAVTESCSVYMLSEDKNFITTNELRALYDYGLGVVFEVKEKPKFCFDALICFILGVLQVLAGILVCALTLGQASQIGFGLIAEGVSDMISGIEGMIKGTFSWASWAISKSISIGLSLLTAGFSMIKNAATSVFKATKALLKGVPKAALNKENFKIDQKYEEQLKRSVNFLCQEVTPQLIQDCTKEREVISRLSERQKHNKKSASHKQVESRSAENTAELVQYAEDMNKADRPATTLDVYVLTKSKLLHGKGIQLSVVDENGKLLTKEHYPGAKKSAGDIKLILTKSTTGQNPIQTGAELYRGHFDIVQGDGKIVSVDVDHQNAIYHAVARANGDKTTDVNKEALVLREKVKNEIQANPETYAPVINLQRGYDFSIKNPRKYGLPGGSKKEADSVLQEYLQSVAFIRSDERILIKMYHLGLVGEKKRVLSARESRRSTGTTLDISYIPPKDSIRQALAIIESSASANEFKIQNPELHKLINRIKTDNTGQSLVAMEVLGQDHRRALTTGTSWLSQTARKLLADTMISGDVELLLKRCMILHHPMTSRKLRDAMRESVPSQSPVLSDDGIRGYYKAGYRSLVWEYSRLGVLNQNQRERLDAWVTGDQHEDTNTAEYNQVLQGLAGTEEGEHIKS
ncbi:Protein translocase subunit SecA [Clarias magur]|uniref:Protein translocase subunit SecA n=1 Tax=Clarias magur TaxID=1594786 RepID=A0A8J4T9S2_CLAMG|nr:Protein translocase subunit SecA [Clarias magur]